MAMVSVTYAFYSQTYGGGLSEAAFCAVLPDASRHVGWLVDGRQPSRCERDAYKRAVCAVCDVFAQYGRGQVGGFAIGEFRMTSYDGRGSVTGEQLATRAASQELAGTTLLFSGVR